MYKKCVKQFKFSLFRCNFLASAETSNQKGRIVPADYSVAGDVKLVGTSHKSRVLINR